MSTWIKTFFIMVGSTILTTVSIQAVDTLDVKKISLLASVFGGGAGDCPSGMVLVGTSDVSFCVDQYEVSAGDRCLHDEPKTRADSHMNLSDPECVPVSEPKKRPWTSITQDQAARACERAGKKLPGNKEWHIAAAATPDVISRDKSGCLLSGGEARDTGIGELCVSQSGIYDMVGNVWEWTGDILENGTLNGQSLPDGGYVVAMSPYGFPTETSANKEHSIGGDKFWIKKEGVVGVFRGGYWNSQTDGGIAAIHAEMDPSFSGTAIGFRCIK